MFKVKHDLSPPFMKELFTYVGNDKGTRSGDTFLRPKVDSVYKGEQSLRSFGHIVWNNLLVVILRTNMCSFYMLVLIYMLFFDFLYLPGVFYQFIFKIQAKEKSIFAIFYRF